MKISCGNLLEIFSRSEVGRLMAVLYAPVSLVSSGYCTFQN